MSLRTRRRCHSYTMSFTDMLNASDDFSTPTPGNLHSRCFEPNSLDDDDILFSPAHISLASGTASTSISSVEDTSTTSPAYHRLVRQFTNSQLELTILKREHHRLQYVLPTKTSPKILTLKQVDARGPRASAQDARGHTRRDRRGQHAKVEALHNCPQAISRCTLSRRPLSCLAIDPTA
jgi:hypothetical protein